MSNIDSQTLAPHAEAGHPLAPKAFFHDVFPGVALCAAVTLAAIGVAAVERRVFGQSWLEALVLAIVIGTAVRLVWAPGARWQTGIAFSGKILLEVAVMLLGASVSLRTLASVGPGLLFGIAGVVITVVAASFAFCRLLALPPRMAMLVACGNSICGNSAIAAVAPVIGADSDDVAASIAFTAVLGVIVVLALPLVATLLGLSVGQAGAFAGLTVYAVPQVIAATTPIGAAAVQIGTLVKLVRVLMLGPVILVLSMLAHHFSGSERSKGSSRLPLHKIVPWFIVAFLILAVFRSLDAIPHGVLTPIADIADILTILSMAALGLGVDVRDVARAGVRITVAVSGSLVLLGATSLFLIHALALS